MVEPASFEELDQAIGKVLDAETTNFFKLANLLGLDPKQDFAGADLSGTDFFEGDLAGANFAGTDLRSANLAFTNLQGANLTNAHLGISRFTYLPITQKNNYVIEDRNLDSVFASASVLYSAIDRVIDSLDIDIDIDINRALASARSHAHALCSTLDIARTLNIDRTSIIAFNIARAIDLSSARVHARAIVFTITRAIDLVRNRTISIDSSTINRNLNNARIRAHAFDSDLADITSAFINSIGFGANLYKANLTGTRLDGANVEGAIMISCTGLSDSEIADLKNRGAIFDGFPGDRSEVGVPVRR